MDFFSIFDPLTRKAQTRSQQQMMRQATERKPRPAPKTPLGRQPGVIPSEMRGYAWMLVNKILGNRGMSQDDPQYYATLFDMLNNLTLGELEDEVEMIMQGKQRTQFGYTPEPTRPVAAFTPQGAVDVQTRRTVTPEELKRLLNLRR